MGFAEGLLLDGGRVSAVAESGGIRPFYLVVLMVAVLKTLCTKYGHLYFLAIIANITAILIEYLFIAKGNSL